MNKKTQVGAVLRAVLHKEQQAEKHHGSPILTTDHLHTNHPLINCIPSPGRTKRDHQGHQIQHHAIAGSLGMRSLTESHFTLPSMPCAPDTQIPKPVTTECPETEESRWRVPQMPCKLLLWVFIIGSNSQCKNAQKCEWSLLQSTEEGK